MTRATRSVSFSPDHYDLLLRVARDRREGFSEVVRRTIDFAIDHDASLGLPFCENRRKALQAELLAVDATISTLQAEHEASKVAESTRESRDERSPKPAFVDNRVVQSPEDRWRKKVAHLLNPPAHLPQDDLDRVAGSVAEAAGAHPDWVDGLPPDERAGLRTRLDRLTAQSCPAK